MEITLYRAIVLQDGKYLSPIQLVSSTEEAQMLFAGTDMEFIKIVDPVTIEVPDETPTEEGA